MLHVHHELAKSIIIILMLGPRLMEKALSRTVLSYGRGKREHIATHTDF